MARLLFAFLAGLALVDARPQPSSRTTHVVHERRAASPHGWTLTRRADPSIVLPLRIGLTQPNLHTLESHLLDVSDPVSPNYGQHWTPERVVEHFSPSQNTIDEVMRWLEEEGIQGEKKLSNSKGWIELNVSVADTERLLKTEYHIWEDHDGMERVGCHEYSVPHHLKEHIDLIKPGVYMNVAMHPRTGFVKRSPASSTVTRPKVNLGSPSSGNGPKTNGKQITGPLKGGTKNPGSSTLGLADCDEFITPICLKTLYNLNRKPSQTKRNTFGVVEFTPQAFLQPDLDLFFTNFSASQVGQKPILVSIDGGVAQTQEQSFDFNGESDLDLEYAMSLTDPQPVLLLQTGDLVEGAGFDNWLDAVDRSFCTFEGGDDPTQDGIYPDPLPGGFNHSESCGIIRPPNVVSVSYGQDEVTISAKSAERQCAEYGKIGLLGTTVLYSSGDFGVAGFGNVCLDADGTEDPAGVRFNPSFPSGCPFVTSVGATQVNPGAKVTDPEGACEQVIFSGGGFSNIFAMPSYQRAAVQSFLKNHPPPFSAAQFNNSGNSRAFPDLSANGANYVIGLDGEFALVFGTSASAPTTGSIITLLNDARLSIGKGPVGFINPAIYSPFFEKAFNDITTGGNQGCGTPGFTSTTGWDPVTGVGTPNFEKLMPLFLALP